jgi:hypothetical protein
MSSINADLGNVEYIYLRNADCNNGTGGELADTFNWDLPYMNATQEPIMFIQVVQVYIDHDDGAYAGTPQHLRLVSPMPNQGYYATNGNGTTLATLLQRDALAGHWDNIAEAPILQLPSSTRSLKFTLNSNRGTNPLLVLGTNSCLDILLKVIRPKQGELTNQIMQTFAYSQR